MTSKYAAVTPKLPRFNPLSVMDKTYQDKVNTKVLEILQPPADEEQPSDERLQDELEMWVKGAMANLSEACQILTQMAKGRRQGVVFARVYNEIRAIRDAVDKRESDLHVLEDAYTQLMVDQFEVEGTTGLTLDTGEAIRIQYEPYAVVVDKDLFLSWCIEEGLQRSLALPWQTTNMLVKDRLLRGESDPPGIVAHTKVKPVLIR
jgi:hypothetical protein